MGIINVVTLNTAASSKATWRGGPRVARSCGSCAVHESDSGKKNPTVSLPPTMSRWPRKASSTRPNSLLLVLPSSEGGRSPITRVIGCCHDLTEPLGPASPDEWLVITSSRDRSEIPTRIRSWEHVSKMLNGQLSLGGEGRWVKVGRKFRRRGAKA
jgi:hypothetical protein